MFISLYAFQSSNLSTHRTLNVEAVLSLSDGRHYAGTKSVAWADMMSPLIIRDQKSLLRIRYWVNTIKFDLNLDSTAQTVLGDSSRETDERTVKREIWVTLGMVRRRWISYQQVYRYLSTNIGVSGTIYGSLNIQTYKLVYS